MRVGPLPKSIISGVAAAAILATTIAVTTVAITVIGSTPLAIGVGAIGTIVTGVLLLYAAFKMLEAVIVHARRHHNKVIELTRDIQFSPKRDAQKLITETNKILSQLDKKYSAYAKDKDRLKFVKAFSNSPEFRAGRCTDAYINTNAQIQTLIGQISKARKAEAREVWIEGYANGMGQAKKDNQKTNSDQNDDTEQFHPVILEVVQQIDGLQIEQTAKDKLLQYFIQKSSNNDIDIPEGCVNEIVKTSNQELKTASRDQGQYIVNFFCRKIKGSEDLVEVEDKYFTFLEKNFTPVECQGHLIKILEAYKEASFFDDKDYMAAVNDIVDNRMPEELGKLSALTLANECQEKTKNVKAIRSKIDKLSKFKPDDNLDRATSYPEIEFYEQVAQITGLISNNCSLGSELYRKLWLELIENSPLKLSPHELDYDRNNEEAKAEAEKFLKNKPVTFSDKMQSSGWSKANQNLDQRVVLKRINQIVAYGNMQAKETWWELQSLVMPLHKDDSKLVFGKLQFVRWSRDYKIADITNDKNPYGLEQVFLKGLQENSDSY